MRFQFSHGGQDLDLIAACGQLLQARPRLLRYLFISAVGALLPLLPGLEATARPLQVFLEVSANGVEAVEKLNDTAIRLIGEISRANPLLCAFEFPDERPAMQWSAQLLARLTNWQIVAVTLSAVRTRSHIARSVLPLLKGICAMAFEMPGELSRVIGVKSAVPVSVERFLSTRFACAVTGVHFASGVAATPVESSDASKKRPRS
jgi:hypothetical protein